MGGDAQVGVVLVGDDLLQNLYDLQSARHRLVDLTPNPGLSQTNQTYLQNRQPIKCMRDFCIGADGAIAGGAR